MRNVKITLVVGVTLLVILGALTLSHSPVQALRSTPAPNAVVDYPNGSTAICQANEVLPAGTSAIRLSIWAFYGSHLRVAVYSGSRLLTEGTRGSNWTGGSVTVPVKRVNQTTSNVKLCFAIGPNSQPMLVFGTATGPREAAVVVRKNNSIAQALSRGLPLPGRARPEYLTQASGSWWSRISLVARHLGLGRFYSGSWIALLIAALMAAISVLALRLTLREIS